MNETRLPRHLPRSATRTRCCAAVAAAAVVGALLGDTAQSALRAAGQTAPTVPAPSPTPLKDAGSAEPLMPPALAGARYGQAVGASRVCPNIHLLPAAEAFKARYDGSQGEVFTKHAQSIALMWEKTLSCDPAKDINRCRILSEKSCSETIKELGAEGTIVRGLVEFRK